MDLTTDSQVNRIGQDDPADVTLADQPATPVVSVKCSTPCQARSVLNKSDAEIKTLHVTFGNIANISLADLDTSPQVKRSQTPVKSLGNKGKIRQGRKTLDLKKPKKLVDDEDSDILDSHGQINNIGSSEPKVVGEGGRKTQPTSKLVGFGLLHIS